MHAVPSSRRIERRRLTGVFAYLMRLLFVALMTIGFMGLHSTAEAGIVHHGENGEFVCASPNDAGCQDEAKSGANDLCGPSVCAAVPAPEPRAFPHLSLSDALTFRFFETIALGAMMDRATPPPRRL